MRTFNAIQMLIFFAAMPFGINWLNGAEFRGAGALFWVAIVGYVALFIWLCALVRIGMGEWDKS